MKLLLGVLLRLQIRQPGSLLLLLGKLLLLLCYQNIFLGGELLQTIGQLQGKHRDDFRQVLEHGHFPERRGVGQQLQQLGIVPRCAVQPQGLLALMILQQSGQTPELFQGVFYLLRGHFVAVRLEDSQMLGHLAQRFAGDIENARQNRAGIDRRNGPGVRFSFSEEEADAMREEGIYVSPGPSALNKSKDNKSVSFVLAKNISMLEDMEPVAHLSGKELNDRTIDLPVQIKNWFDSFGNAETRDGLGTVLFDEYGVGGIMNHKPLNRAKVVTVMATRDVVKYGKQLSYETNWKGRGYDSIIYGAPVTVGSENTKLYVAAVVDIIQENKFYMNECVDSDGNYVRINEGPPSSTKTGFTVQDGVTRGPGEPSIHSIAQVSEESNTSEINNPDAVDWEGNRELKQSISEDDDGIDLSRYSGRDRVYMEAVKNGNTGEAAWMVEDAAKRAGFSHKGFHQTGADFTSFSTKNEVAGQFDDETPTGIFIKPTDEDIGLQSGTKQMPLYFKADNMLEFANREEIRKYWIENVQG